ncbi:N-acetyltransferase [Nostoc sp. TCL26-01]|uniref:GNAT family N-acetyltransferase n=1 Tax=Nostoc sp. TCL26-01 TaxID=2576904 RepID=UPI0015C005FF|nr:GNAT family N-acetyltransferase [Nostoc sp. TCL26-01]QLE55339.1 GNAT family N-acetyltransferase [Nostoc sp. TCL26-01]
MLSSEKVTLRPATKADAPLFYSVIDQTMREFIIATWGAWNEERVQQESLEDSTSPNAQVIQVGNIPVGVILVEREPTHIQVKQIYLLPEYQRKGIGRYLITGIIAEATNSNLPVRLHVLKVNSAKKFYEKLGFIVTETSDEFYFMARMTT